MSIENKLSRIESLGEETSNLLAQIGSGEKGKPKPFRKIEFSDEPYRGETRNINRIMTLPAHRLSDEERELQEFSDNAYLASKIVKIDPRNLKMWQRFEASRSALKKAMDTATAEEGTEWVPTGMSAELIEKFRLESKVAQLFRDIPMPSNPYDAPFLDNNIQFYLVPESKSDEPSKSPASTGKTGKRTMTAVKLKARVIYSDEFDEDSIVPVLPNLKQDIGIQGAETLDDVIINGDNSATHQDSDVTDSKDHRKAWKGIRKLTQASCKKDLSTFDKDTILSLKTAMNKYGANPDHLAWLASVKTSNKMLALAELRTVDKYGPKATIVTGEIGKIYGAPVIISESVREDVDATGVHGASANTFTLLILVNKRAFMMGSRGLVKVNVRWDDEVDQNILTFRFRKTFIDRWAVSATNLLISVGYKIS